MRPADKKPIPPAASPQQLPKTAALPSVETLGGHLADLERGHDALDERSLSAEPAQRLTYDAQMALLYERIMALRTVVLTMRPQTLADAAVAAHVAAKRAAGMRGVELNQQDREQAALAVERALYAIVPILAEAAGLDMEAMDFAADAELADYRFSGLEAVA